MRLAGRADGNLDVLAQIGQELHQTLDREHPRAVAHQRGDVRLLDAEDRAGLRLGEAARPDERVDLQRQARLPLPSSKRIRSFLFFILSRYIVGAVVRCAPAACRLPGATRDEPEPSRVGQSARP